MCSTSFASAAGVSRVGMVVVWMLTSSRAAGQLWARSRRARIAARKSTSKKSSQPCTYCFDRLNFFPVLLTVCPHVSSWARQDVLFSQLLDILRYLVVWQPIIFMLAKFINFELGLS
jgi:hypothetical protein